jgi:glutathione peroxidase
LQELWTQFHDRGFVIVGIPSNDLIAQTAQYPYGVTFPIAAKTVVKDPNAHPFYRWAGAARPNDVPRWNFHKYLIGRDGYIAEAFLRNRRTDEYAREDRHRSRVRGFPTRDLAELTEPANKSTSLR